MSGTDGRAYVRGLRVFGAVATALAGFVALGAFGGIAGGLDLKKQ